MPRIACYALCAILLAPLGSRLSAQTVASPAPAAAYVVRAGDVLQIRVWPDSALGGTYPVEETGVVYLPLVGAVSAAGRPIAELRDMLRRRYVEAMKEPVVSVTPLFKVAVLGAVERPGLYQVDPSANLYDVISMAGGFRDGANERDVRFIRDGELRRMNVEPGIGAPPDVVELRSGDRIVVPMKHRANLVSVYYLIQSLAVLATLYTVLQK